MPSPRDIQGYGISEDGEDVCTAAQTREAGWGPVIKDFIHSLQ